MQCCELKRLVLLICASAVRLAVGSNGMVGSFVMNSPVGMLQLWNANFPRQFQRTLCVIAKNPVARVHLCHLNVSTRQFWNANF